MSKKKPNEADQYILNHLRHNKVEDAIKCMEEEMERGIEYEEKIIESVFWWQPKKLIKIRIEGTTHIFVKSGIIWRWRTLKDHEMSLFQ